MESAEDWFDVEKTNVTLYCGKEIFYSKYSTHVICSCLHGLPPKRSKMNQRKKKSIPNMKEKIETFEQ